MPENFRLKEAFYERPWPPKEARRTSARRRSVTRASRSRRFFVSIRQRSTKSHPIIHPSRRADGLRQHQHQQHARATPWTLYAAGSSVLSITFPN